MITAAKISSIYCQERFGVSKNIMRYTMLNVFNPLDSNVIKSQATVPPKQLFLLLKVQKLRSSEALALASKGFIMMNNQHCVVVYHGATRANCAKTNHCLLSYRAARPEYQLPAYVLIKPFIDKVDAEVATEEAAK